jgi:hypothetical protein
MARGVYFGLAIVTLTLAGGCRSSDPALKRSELVVDLLVDHRTALMTGEGAVANSQASLKALQQSTGDLRPAFDLFSADIEQVRKEAKRVKAEADEMRLRSVDYVTARTSDVSTIQNQDLRLAAERRAAIARGRYDRIDVLYREVNVCYGTYLQNLEDLHTYLANELNYPALKSAQRWLEETYASAEALRTNLRLLTVELNKASNSLARVPVPADADEGMYSPDAYARRN